ncbi:cyclic diguanylate phosphodiesterase, partial [Enterobacter ludwigii]|nr:cyclic diguanylate phosphodiesterase [Enterobacter ludwigii]
MKKIIAVAIISTLLVILSLYAVNAVIVSQQKSKQLEISHTLLEYSEHLFQRVALLL